MTNVTKAIIQSNGKENAAESQIVHQTQMGTEKIHFKFLNSSDSLHELPNGQHGKQLTFSIQDVILTSRKNLKNLDFASPPLTAKQEDIWVYGEGSIISGTLCYLGKGALKSLYCPPASLVSKTMSSA